MRTAKTTVALFIFWCVLVPPEAVTDVLVGLGCASLLSLWAARFLWPHAEPFFSVLRVAQLPRFALLLTGRIVVAAIQVLRIVLDPRLPIEPVVVRQTVRFAGDAARVAYANAITITPGTLTLDVDGDSFVVHCLDPALARDVVDGRLARDVARLFERRRPS
jgi:multicomponent Na+:H+ antiporter subunit E